jgi:hypothetical protein
MVTELVLIVPVLLVLPFASFRLIRNNWKKLDTVEFKEKFGFLIEGINHRHSKVTKYFHSAFLLRAIMVVLLPIVFNGRDYFQIMFHVLLSQGFIIFYANRRTHTERLEYYTHLLNEVLIMLTNYHLVCYTWFVTDPLTQYNMGYSL